MPKVAGSNVADAKLITQPLAPATVGTRTFGTRTLEGVAPAPLALANAFIKSMSCNKLGNNKLVN